MACLVLYFVGVMMVCVMLCFADYSCVVLVHRVAFVRASVNFQTTTILITLILGGQGVEWSCVVWRDIDLRRPAVSAICVFDVSRWRFYVYIPCLRKYVN